MRSTLSYCMHISPGQVTFGRPRLKILCVHFIFEIRSLSLVTVVQRCMIKLIFPTWSIKNDPSNYGGVGLPDHKNGK